MLTTRADTMCGLSQDVSGSRATNAPSGLKAADGRLVAATRLMFITHWQLAFRNSLHSLTTEAHQGTTSAQGPASGSPSCCNTNVDTGGVPGSS